MSSFFFITEIAVFITGIAYFLLILWFYLGWRKLRTTQHLKTFNPVTVSVVVAVRNEEGNIEKLIRDLLTQDFDNEMFEILIINDHSEDYTQRIVKTLAESEERLQLFTLPDNLSGKKAAVDYGIQNASGEMILQTDGDCRVPEKWISSMVKSYLDSSQTFVSGAVRMAGPNTVFAWLQELEFFSLMAAGAGAIGTGHPLMCNGANLAFSRKKYLKMNDALKMNLASGDDVFLMFAFHRNYPGRIVFNNSRESTVITKTTDTLKSFLFQRKRWVSKSKAYRDPYLIGTALIVLLLNTGLLILLLAALVTDMYFLKIFIMVFLVKSLVDIVLLNAVTAFYGRQLLLYLFPVAQVLYIFYVTVTAITGIWGTFTWKGRNYMV